jgi:NAD(P)-dependent dehydrogenase (short-subunit alcohol dehydrogenase family)
VWAAAALELAPRGIRVNGICPATINTHMAAGLRADPAALSAFLAKVPMPRLKEPDEIAASTLWLASHECRAPPVTS